MACPASRVVGEPQMHHRYFSGGCVVGETSVFVDDLGDSGSIVNTVQNEQARGIRKHKILQFIMIGFSSSRAVIGATIFARAARSTEECADDLRIFSDFDHGLAERNRNGACNEMGF